ncbi:hypothetical protein DFH11DRAFT_1508769 [Phellopilus nigrolimitatus]|nr:hypothetical protein DFH11DRAFT_1508769 [Phellopilus nigrolimitatus]
MSMPVTVDRGYVNLLSHLRQATSTLSFETIQAAICHYLVHHPTTQPTPTPLTASVAASPLWHPLMLNTALALDSTFGNAAQLKWTGLAKEKRGLFDGSASGEFARWTRGVLAGTKGGDVLMSLVVSGGLLKGLGELESLKKAQPLAREVEEMVVLAFAEVTGSSSPAQTDLWASEFKKKEADENSRMDLALLLAANYFTYVSTDSLSALKLLLTLLCLEKVQETFQNGSFLHGAPLSVSTSATGIVSLSPESPLWTNVDAVFSSASFSCIGPLCKLLSRIIALLSDTSMRIKRRKDTWDLLFNIANALYSMASRVEKDWRANLFAGVQHEEQIDPKICELTEKMWTILKTQFFSVLMLQQAVLDVIMFLHSPSTSSSRSFSVSPASRLAETILQTLYLLSFVIASFGGVTVGQGNNADNGRGFPELRKTFYVAIDVLSADAHASEVFVRGLIRAVDSNRGRSSHIPLGHPLMIAERAFVLACVEQFVPVLSDVCIEEDVLPLCEPHLGDPSHRETFESAHSVMLSIFAAHAEKGAVSVHNVDVKGKGVDRREGFVGLDLSRRLVPGYIKLLLQNAEEGKLTTPQFRLAYAALVRSASTGRSPRFPTISSSSSYAKRSDWRWGTNEDLSREPSGNQALAWLCVEELTNAIAARCTSKQEANPARDDRNTAERMRLSLALISLVSNVGLALLPRLLQEVQRVIDGQAGVRRRRVLIESVFEEIMERVGDGEKEYVMRWWYTCARNWDVEQEYRDEGAAMTAAVHHV